MKPGDVLANLMQIHKVEPKVETKIV